jgi:RNA polymerase sigma factor (sigma-70 family)
MLEARAFENEDDLCLFLKGLSPRLAGVFRRYRIPTWDQEDLLQTALLAMVVHADSIRDRSLWLLGAVRNGCLMYQRALRTRQEYTETTQHEGEGSQAACAESAVRRLDVSRAMARLSVRQRRLIRARYWLGCSEREAAQMVGCRPGSVKRTQNRCLSKLRERLAPAS